MTSASSDSAPISAPRIYGIPATDAPIVAVFRRGPSVWSHVGRWDLNSRTYQSGAWLRGRIFPRRSDLSPDGRYLSYFAHKPTAGWELGEAYVAVSKLPWLTALHAFATCGTWSRGYYFTAEGDSESPDGAKLPIPYGLRSIPAEQFANERRRGWHEAPDSPPRHPDDHWDQWRNARMRKPQPRGPLTLCVESLGWAGGEFGAGQAVGGLRVRYSLESSDGPAILDDLQWADWTADGLLLAATRSGRLQIRDLSAKSKPDFDQDLAAFGPDPQPPPGQAQRW
jgi:hypothetical protein